MEKKAIFRQDIEDGDAGERFFSDCFPDYSKVSVVDRNKFDLVANDNSHAVEVKSDFYRLSQTENIFVEVYSNDNDRNADKKSGPWRCLSSEIPTSYVYMFYNDRVLFFFNPEKLVRIVEGLMEAKPPWLALRKVPNKNYDTYGYPISLSVLKDALEAEPVAVVDESFAKTKGWKIRKENTRRVPNLETTKKWEHWIKNAVKIAE